MHTAESIQSITALADVLGTKYLHGKEEVVRLALVALLSGGHILVEDLPGLGKTSVALALAGATGLAFGRIQCTSDLLPADITGLSIFSRESGQFTFMPGPIFNNIVLLDEINRAMPRTQSAMLEAMEERRVTVEGTTYQLPEPFMVIATQNPADQSGTFPLPESQLDRFLICTGIGYPPEEVERTIIAGGGIRERLQGMQQLVSRAELLATRTVIEQEVVLSDKVVGYIYALVTATRRHTHIQTGLSTRAALHLAHASKAAAFLAGRRFVAPDDVKGIACAVCAHRLVLRAGQAFGAGGELLREIIASIPLPLV